LNIRFFATSSFGKYIFQSPKRKIDSLKEASTKRDTLFEACLKDATEASGRELTEDEIQAYEILF